MATDNKEIFIKINSFFDSLDNSCFDCIDTMKYSDEVIRSCVVSKSKFSELNEVCKKITEIVECERFELISHRFIIYAHDYQDALIAAVHLAKTLKECQAIYIEEDSDDGRYIVNHKQYNFAFDSPSIGSRNLNNDNNSSANDLLNQLRHGENFVYNEISSFDGEISQFSFPAEDSDGDDKIIFDIVSNHSQFNMYNDDIDSPLTASPEEKWEESVKKFRESIKTMNVIPIVIGKDSPIELETLMSELIESSGFSVESKAILKDIIFEYNLTDERNIRKTIKRILTNHMLTDMNSTVISYDEVINAAKALENKIIAANKDCSSKASRLIGLDDVLSKIDGIVDMIALAKERADKHLASGMQGCNVTFVGSPGTGKTSAARYFAKKLYDKGIIPSERNFVECRKSDLVGLYVGWTASKIDSLFKRLHEMGGGVLLIDEAYALAEDEKTCFDTEAVNALVLNMENYRNTVFCVFAGYEDKMDRFLSSNNGLRSRIQFNVKFHDYDNSDLFEIFNCIVTDNDFTIPDDSRPIVEEYFDKLKAVRGGQFGNGREARNLFSNAMQKLSARISNKKRHSKKDISNITKNDLVLAVEDIIGSETANTDNIKVGFKL